MTLTKLQRETLLAIVGRMDGAGEAGFPAGGGLGTAQEKALVKKGLVRVFTFSAPFGGGGAIGRALVDWELAEPTDKGWETAAELLAVK